MDLDEDGGTCNAILYNRESKVVIINSGRARWWLSIIVGHKHWRIPKNHKTMTMQNCNKVVNYYI